MSASCGLNPSHAGRGGLRPSYLTVARGHKGDNGVSRFVAKGELPVPKDGCVECWADRSVSSGNARSVPKSAGRIGLYETARPGAIGFVAAARFLGGHLLQLPDLTWVSSIQRRRVDAQAIL